MWEKLTRNKRHGENEVWCMLGDFNVTRNSKERKGLSEDGN